MFRRKYDSKKGALTIVGVILIILTVFSVVLAVGYYLFIRNPSSATKKGLSIPSDKIRTVNISGAFQSDGYKNGRLGIVVASGAKVLNNSSHLTSLFTPVIQADISSNQPIYVKVLDLVSKSLDYNAPYDTVEWMGWKDTIPPFKWAELDKINEKYGGFPNLYLTEGGIFTEYEMKNTTDLYFSPQGWGENAEKVFLKLEFPNGKKPFNSETEDNTIALYSPLSKEDTTTVVYGIPQKSILTLIERDKNDGPERQIDKFTVSEPIDRLYIDGKKGIKIINS